MSRRSFMAGLAGLPIVGWGARMFGLQKPIVKSGITVHGPELINLTTMDSGPVILLSLRFEHIPTASAHGFHVAARLKPLFGSINKRRFGRASARALIFVDYSVSQPKDGHCSVICAFRSASRVRPYPGSHRPVNFETEILKALEG
jgi:hypothetical protein